jgi:succinate-acetate transporter protein
MGVLTFIYLVAGIRTNVALEIIFLTLTVGFWLTAGAYFQLASLNATLANNLQVVSLIR